MYSSLKMDFHFYFETLFQSPTREETSEKLYKFQPPLELLTMQLCLSD